MSQCEKGIDCLECSSRGMCSSYANFKYQQGRIDAIDEFMKTMEEWDKRVKFIRDECAFFTISNIRDMAEQIKAK